MWHISTSVPPRFLLGEHDLSTDRGRRQAMLVQNPYRVKMLSIRAETNLATAWVASISAHGPPRALPLPGRRAPIPSSGDSN